MSQSQLAERLNVSRVAVTKWESGQTQNLKLVNLVALCRLFRLPADELLRGELEYSKADGNAAAAHQANEPSANACIGPQFSRKLHGYHDLTDEGRAMVDAQITVAIETARRLYGTRNGPEKTVA
jgi:transcriptional regulator with XRE-family HTH domain